MPSKEYYDFYNVKHYCPGCMIYDNCQLTIPLSKNFWDFCYNCKPKIMSDYVPEGKKYARKYLPPELSDMLRKLDRDRNAEAGDNKDWHKENFVELNEEMEETLTRGYLNDYQYSHVWEVSGIGEKHSKKLKTIMSE